MKHPDFLWDRGIPPETFHRVVNDAGAPQHDAWLALLLREAQPKQVWGWTTPQHVDQHLSRIGPRLGRRQTFWLWLFDGWRESGLLGPPADYQSSTRISKRPKS